MIYCVKLLYSYKYLLKMNKMKILMHVEVAFTYAREWG